MMIFLFGALCDEGTEHESAYRLLACAVKEVYGLSALPDIARRDGGKPYFLQRSDICFNLSHSRGAVVCALHDREIGVDVEKLRAAPKRLADGMEDLDFFRLWTAKEATVKREGRGLEALLRDFLPDRLCRTKEDFLPGWMVTVCPAEEADIQWRRVDCPPG